MEKRRKMNSQIVGIEIYTPEKKLTNFDLEKMVDTSNDWIMQRTGIKERRIADSNESASDLGTKAAEKLLKKSNIEPGEIDLIIVSTLTPDRILPSTACKIQHNIGAKNIPAFDISAACTGFIYALTIAEQFIKNGKCKNILIISTEIMSKFADWKNRSTCILFGDGAGAVLLTKSNNYNQILSSYIKADGYGVDYLNIPAGGSKLPASENTVKNKQHYLQMNGKEVFKFSMWAFKEALLNGIKQADIKLEDVDLIIPHQANYRIIESNAKKINIPMEKFYLNLDRYGNTSSASIPIALYEALNEGRIKKGDIIALIGFGGGYTWGSVILKW